MHLQQISLKVPAEKWAETIDFYKQFGFKIVEESTIVYLHLFSDVGMGLSLEKGQMEAITFTIQASKEFVQQTQKVIDPCGNTIYFVIGKYESTIPKKQIQEPELKKEFMATGKKIGILTSGGDACGMNSAVRAITRVALQKGCIPFAIYEGYQGLVDGGDKIKQLYWDDVRGYLGKGGTLIGTARCADFRTREGRLKSCLNLIKNGIDALVIIGGDGSLTGADLFRSEWTGLVEELVATGRVTAQESDHLKENLSFVGLVGSIDNDMSSTDITIGAVTSLHRICESVDALVSTAQSHQRAFVIEVMGRHCGWLGLMAAIAVGADTVFLPERPPPLNPEKFGSDWKAEMCDIIKKNRLAGNRKSLVIVCEGAIDRELNPIKPEEVKKALEVTLGLDTRVTTLGHVQRGGSTCAFDRYLATVQGVEAVETVLKTTKDTPAPMIGMSNNKIISIPLLEAVKLTKDVSSAIAKKDFAHAMELRDPDFTSSYNAYIESSLKAKADMNSLPDNKRLRIGILHIGAPAGGMNAATRIIARLCRSRGHTPLAIKNGFSGLINDEVKELQWEDVRGWQTVGGSQLGTNRDHPRPIPGTPLAESMRDMSYVETGAIAFHLQKNNIEALIIIGGFEGFTSQLTLTESRKYFPALCIPMVHIPATISNNVPATDFSIGSDTALNVIVESCDSIRLSANASRNRVFVVEVHGGNCGYLATLSALTVGATSSYIPEEPLTLQTLVEDVQHLKRRYAEEIKNGIQNEGRVVLRAENINPAVYSTKVLAGMLKAEGKGLFDARETVLGHLQQGDTPSPLDRIRATRLAVKAVDWIQKVMEEVKPSETRDIKSFTSSDLHSCIVGIKGADIIATPIKEALKDADLLKRRVNNSWWMQLRGLIRILGKREYHK